MMMRIRLFKLLCLLLLGLSAPLAASVPDPSELASAPVQLPLIANQGQVAGNVAYYADTFGGRVFVTHDGQMAYRLRSGGERGDLAIMERFADAKTPQLSAGKPAQARISAFAGPYGESTRSELAAYEGISFGEVYAGVEVNLTVRGQSLEKIFRLAPQAQPEQIALEIAGVQQLRLAEDGRLLLDTTLGEVAFSAPIAWQQIDGLRREIAVRYRIVQAQGERATYGFELAEYDRSQPLWIDPVLVATNLGGPDGANSSETINSLLLADGALFVAGTATASDFPTNPGVVFPTRPAGSRPGYIARLSTDLTTLQAATYLGGNLNDPKIRVRSGSLYFAATARDASFPTVAGAFDGSFNGGPLGDIAIARLNLSLNVLERGTFLGSPGNDVFYDMETYSGVTESMVCVSGFSSSDSYPTTATAFDTSNVVGIDAVLTCLSLGLNQLNGSTFFGGGSTETGVSLAMMPDGVLFHGIALAGTTAASSLPAMSGLQTSNAGLQDSFVVVFTNSSLSSISAGTFLGGAEEDLAEEIIYHNGLDSLFVVGRTRSVSSPGQFPTTAAAFQSSGSADWDIFATRLPRDLSSLQASTLLGGSGIDEVSGATFNGTALVILGLTTSPDLPTVAARAYAEAPVGLIGTSATHYEAYIAQLSPGLSALNYGSYYGVYQFAIFQSSSARENRPQTAVSVFDRVPGLDLARDSTSGDLYFPFLNANPTEDGFQSNLDNPGIVRMNLLGNVADLQAAPSFLTVGEGAGSVTLTASRSGNLDGFSRAIFARQSGGAAQEGDDYVVSPPLPHIYIWQPGQSNTFQSTVSIVDDDVQEAPSEVAFFGYNDDILGANRASSGFQAQIVIVDDDSAGILAAPDSLSLTEGQTLPLGVRLNSSPPPGTPSVNVRIKSSDTSVATIAGADALGIRTLSFSASNWDQQQFAQIVADDNASVDGNRSFAIEFLDVFHPDPFIDAMTLAPIPGMVADNDVAGIDSRFSAAQTTSEADAGIPAEIAQIRLTSEPAALVSAFISVSADAAGEGTLNTTSVHFDNSNWNQYQSVFVTPVDDTIADGNRSYEVLRGVSSADGNYHNPTPTAFVQVTNLDDEMAQIDLDLTLDSGQPQGFVLPNVTFSGTEVVVSNASSTAIANAAVSLSVINANVSSWSCTPGPGAGVNTLCQSAGGSGAFTVLVDIGAGESVIFSADLLPTAPLGSTLSVSAGVQPPPGVADPVASNNQSSYQLLIATSADIFADGFE